MKPPPTKKGSLAADVDAARDEARDLLRAQSELAWRNWVYGDPLDLAKTYEGHEALFSKGTIDKVKALEEQSLDPLKRRAFDYLRVFLEGEFVGRSTAALSDKVATLEAEATFQGADGSEHPYRELERLIAGEKDHRLRVALYEASLPVIEKLNPLLSEREALTAGLLPKLGYANSQAFSAAVRRGGPRRAQAGRRRSLLTSHRCRLSRGNGSRAANRAGPTARRGPPTRHLALQPLARSGRLLPARQDAGPPGGNTARVGD